MIWVVIGVLFIILMTRRVDSNYEIFKKALDEAQANKKRQTIKARDTDYREDV